MLALLLQLLVFFVGFCCLIHHCCTLHKRPQTVIRRDTVVVAEAVPISTNMSLMQARDDKRGVEPGPIGGRGRERKERSRTTPREASSWSAMKATGKLVPGVGATARAFMAWNRGLEAANASASGAWPFSNRLESV